MLTLHHDGNYYTTTMTSRRMFCHNPASYGTNQPIRKPEFVTCMKVEYLINPIMIIFKFGHFTVIWTLWTEKPLNRICQWITGQPHIQYVHTVYTVLQLSTETMFNSTHHKKAVSDAKDLCISKFSFSS